MKSVGVFGRLRLVVAVVGVGALNAFGSNEASSDAIAEVRWETLPRYCRSNVGLIKGPVKGILVEHHWLGDSSFKADEVKAYEDFAARGIVRISPHYSPWAWMNDYAVRLTDALVAVVKRHYGLGEDAIVVSTGLSMGGQGCLVWPRYSRHRVSAVVANCPVTDLVYHYTERPDLPRTICCAFADAPDLQTAIAAHSPFHLVKSLPDIPYFIVHSTADASVNKERHTDRFVAAMRAAGRRVEYVASEGTGHCKLTPEAQARYDAALLAPFSDAHGELLAGLDRRAEAMRAKVVAAASAYPRTGTVYYFAETGDDANDGLKPERPKRTLAAASALTLKPGDAVLFRRGDLFRGFMTAQAGVTYSAWGEGPKPTLCGSFRDYADPSLWVTTGVANVWRCTERLYDVGCVFFDFDPREVGRMDVPFGTMALPGRKEPYDKPMALTNDLAFCNLFHENALLLRSDRGNPGSRFRHIEIGTMAKKHIIEAFAPDVTIDSIHFTCCGGNAVGNRPKRNFEVRNCIFNHLGGSVLLGWAFGTVRFGNAVEVWDGVDGYRVHDNWMYQIYDTAVTHQRNDSRDFVCIMRNVEYWNNLIERCYWAIEYYNQRNAPGSTTEDVYVHDNFCRLTGAGWGCLGRAHTAMAYSFGDPPSVTRNYRTERNVFDRSLGWLFYQYGTHLEPKGAHAFKDNTYVQWADRPFASVLGKEVSNRDAPAYLAERFGETSARVLEVPAEGPDNDCVVGQ